MRIVSSNLAMQSQYSSEVSDSEEARLTVRQITAPSHDSTPPSQDTAVNISAAGRALNLSAPAKTEDSDTVLDAKQQALVDLIERFVEAMTGKKIKIQLAHLSSPNSETPQVAADVKEQAQSQQSQPQNDVAISFDYKKIHSESEQVTFATAGSVTTSDGRTIDFELGNQLSRQYSTDTEVHLDNGKAVDPLIVNLDGSPTSFQENGATFDLNSDGTKENIPFVSAGSGFLVVDKNGDGIVNDGSELIGAASGNAYQELASYDSDKNGWIDEADPVFSTMGVWSKNGDGQDKVQSLCDAGIGAIAVGQVSTPYSFKNDQNGTVANLQSSGVYLKEDGTPGTVQQVDLVV